MGAGSLLVVHIWRGWNYRSQRILGLMLTSLFTLLILSAYLLYYVGEEDVRSWIGIIHR